MEPIIPLKDVEHNAYENSQFDPEVPTDLGGVMRRWIVPETEPKPITVRVPTLSLDETEDDEEENGEDVVLGSVPNPPPHLSGFLQRNVLLYFLGTGFVILVILNLFLIFRN